MDRFAVEVRERWIARLGVGGSFVAEATGLTDVEALQKVAEPAADALGRMEQPACGTLSTQRVFRVTVREHYAASSGHVLATSEHVDRTEAIRLAFDQIVTVGT